MSLISQEGFRNSFAVSNPGWSPFICFLVKILSINTSMWRSGSKKFNAVKKESILLKWDLHKNFRALGPYFTKFVTDSNKSLPILCKTFSWNSLQLVFSYFHTTVTHAHGMMSIAEYYESYRHSLNYVDIAAHNLLFMQKKQRHCN